MQRLLWLLFFVGAPVFSQQDSLVVQTLDSTLIKSYRLPSQVQQLPFSVSKLRFRESGNNKQQLHLDEYLNSVPGVFNLNSQNYAQDLRISIRGFGSRSAFGIRGIQLIVDGIPETTPDGQGQLDNLNLAIIDQIEVIRGSSSVLYGNASGGAISITTLQDIDSSFVKPSVMLGAYGLRQEQVVVGWAGEQQDLVIQGSHTKSDGYRDHSGFETYNFNTKWHHRPSDQATYTFLVNYAHSPLAQDAGSLTATEVEAQRRQARDRNLIFEAGENVSQVKVGASQEYRWSNFEWSSYAFYSYRDFAARLPFENGGQVGVNRNYFGVGSSIKHQWKKEAFENQVQGGITFGHQNDLRKRFDNLEGDQGELRLNQHERFSALGTYLLDKWSSGRWNLVAGLRYDVNRLAVADRLLTDGNATAQTNLNAWSTSLGANYSINQEKAFHLSYSTSFETPALSELSANPNNDGGFNPDLRPQRAQNIELAYKIDRSFDRIQVTGFYTWTNDDLVPFELQDFPDRTFYRNAGSTERLGIEISYQRQLSKSFQLLGAYTFSDFSYRKFQTPVGNLDGKTLPGIPKHNAALTLDHRRRDFQFQITANYRGSLYADNENTVTEPEVFLLHVNTSYDLHWKQQVISPFLGINNLLDQSYNDNIRINAFGGRYFEPAAPINLYGGIRWLF
ncbi:TonB-dependent receptor family protein [Nonlabens xiamenensis]|uniref:TonB-dependent receptor family protein n=1 Tax=Nonlabens xiamenensis TaxID=2341043 RepID=UPI000F606526|nr:TonB-dependent receptor [Nonlabens xiamenensis]